MLVFKRSFEVGVLGLPFVKNPYKSNLNFAYHLVGTPKDPGPQPVPAYNSSIIEILSGPGPCCVPYIYLIDHLLKEESAYKLGFVEEFFFPIVFIMGGLLAFLKVYHFKDLRVNPFQPGENDAGASPCLR